MKSRWWRIWAKSLGDKASLDDKEADKITWIRAVILIHVVIFNYAVVANCTRHW